QRLAVEVDLLLGEEQLDVADQVDEHEAHEDHAGDRHDPLLADGTAVEAHRQGAALAESPDGLGAHSPPDQFRRRRHYTLLWHTFSGYLLIRGRRALVNPTLRCTPRPFANRAGVHMRTLDVLEQGIADGTHIGAQVYVSRGREVLADAAVGDATPGVPMT